MLKLRKGKTKSILEASIDAALLGVEVYNKPRTTFRTQGYIALMIIAWTRLFHAYFRKTIGEKYYYKKKNGRYEIVEGDRKSWDIKTCITKYNKLGEAAKSNLYFFITLRNKIEHRSIIKSEIDNLIFGECQSLLYNYENRLIHLFGPEYALHENLVYSLQFSHLRTEEQEQAHRKAWSKEIKEIWNYVERYRTNLRDEIFNSQEYSIKLIQIPKISNTNRNDLAIEFVKWSELSEEDKERYNKLHAIIKDKVVEKEKVKVVKIKPDDVLYGLEEGACDKPSQIARITRNARESEGVLLHEKFSDKLLDETNNVMSLNELLAKGSKKFVYTKEVYYQIYSKRETVGVPDEQIELLALTGFNFYAPVLSWLLQLPLERCTKIIKEVSNDPKHPSVYNIMKLTILLGYHAEEWLDQRLMKKWRAKGFIPPAYYAFKEMRRQARTKDRRLAALRTEADRQIKFFTKKEVLTTILLKNPDKAKNLLSKYCMYVSLGEKKWRDICRFLDVLAYGNEISAQGYKIVQLLRGSG
jgi:hypothetical protein